MRKRNFTHLTIAAGNVSIPSLIGCVAALEKQALLENVTQYASSGNGCFLSVPLCLGCSAIEISDLLFGYQQKLFLDSHSYQHWVRNQCEQGEEDNMQQYMDTGFFFSELLTKKLTLIPTFQQLYLSTGKKLYLTSHNISTGKSCYFSVDDSPKMSVLTAIRLSLGVQYISSNLSYDGDLYVDAASSNPLPISCFRSRERILAIRNCPDQYEYIVPKTHHDYACMLLDIACERLLTLAFSSCLAESLFLTITSNEEMDFYNLSVDGYEQTIKALKYASSKESTKVIWDQRKK